MKSMFSFIREYKIVFFSILIVWLLFFIGVAYIAQNLSFSITPSMKLENLGLFGDSFNVLTSLFTGLAFAGVIISVILQTRELAEAREEFRGQKEALQKQQAEMAFQSFDSKFFQMLSLLNNIIENLEHESANETLRKRRVLKYIKELFIKKIRERNAQTLEEFQSIFDEINDEHDTNFKYYFINLFQIFKYIDKHCKTLYNPREYTNILRAQLSKDELVLLLFNGYGVKKISGKQYQYFIENYSLFEHLKHSDLVFCENNIIINLLLSEYKEEAFGKNSLLKDYRNHIKTKEENG